MESASIAPPGYSGPLGQFVAQLAPLEQALGHTPEASREADPTEGIRPGLFRRAFASWVDVFLFVPLVLALHARYEFDIYTFAPIIALWLTYHYMCDLCGGQTLGMRVFHMRTVMRDGAAPTPRAASARAVVGLLDLTPIVMLVIYLVGRRRTLADLAAGTVVVEAELLKPTPHGLGGVAMFNPLLWIAPALVLAVLAAEGRLPGTFRAEVNKLCTQARAVATQEVAARHLASHPRLVADAVATYLFVKAAPIAPPNYRSQATDLAQRFTAVLNARFTLDSEEVHHLITASDAAHMETETSQQEAIAYNEARTSGFGGCAVSTTTS